MFKKCLLCEPNRQILFFVKKIMHNFKIGFKFVKTFFIVTYILAQFNGETSKVILVKKINRFLRSMTQGLINRDFIKKIIIII